MNVRNKIAVLYFFTVTLAPLYAITDVCDFRGRSLSAYAADKRLVQFGPAERVRWKLVGRRYLLLADLLPVAFGNKTLTLSEIHTVATRTIVETTRSLGAYVGDSEAQINQSIELRLKQDLNDLVQFLTGFEPLN